LASSDGKIVSAFNETRLKVYILLLLGSERQWKIKTNLFTHQGILSEREGSVQLTSYQKQYFIRRTTFVNLIRGS
jgi:hypothetical protein